MEHLKFETPDMVAGNIEKIGALFPSAITEMRGEHGQIKKGINFEVLKQLLSRDVVDGDECYEFTWVGKKAAMAEAARPITKTLRPVKEDSRDWNTTQNLYIEGDNLEVLKILQESYLGKVKMIYIDPPYNTGHDFIYRDKFQRSQQEENEQMGMYDEDENQMFENTESNGRFHSDWCSMMYSRLTLAHNLLAEDGAIFISADDNEIYNLRKICDDVFGEDNFAAQIVVVNNLKGRNDQKNVATCHEYMLLYGRENFVANGLPLTDEQKAAFDRVDENGNRYQLRDLRKRGQGDRREDRPNMFFPIYYNRESGVCSLEYHDGWIEIYPYRGDGSDGRWRWGKDRVLNNLSLLEARQVRNSEKWGIEYRIYLNPSLNINGTKDDQVEDAEERDSKSKSFWNAPELSTDVARRQMKSIFENAVFDFPKSCELIKKALYLGTKYDDIILDFFSGSSTTAHAVMKLNAEDGGHRKFIMVQFPEPCGEKTEAFKAGYKNICEIGKERIRRAGDKIKADNPLGTQDLDTGFRVFRVDSSNMKDVYYHPEELDQQSLGEMISNIKDDRTDLDLLYACLLDWGVEIHLPHTSTDLDGCTIHNVDNGALMACFNTNVPTSVVEYMAKQQPLRAVFRDSAFASDDAKINVTEIFKNLSPDTKVKVI